MATRRAGPNGNLTHFFFLYFLIFLLGSLRGRFGDLLGVLLQLPLEISLELLDSFSFPLSSAKSKIHRLYYRGALNHAQGVFLQLVDHHFASCLKTRIHYRSHTHAARLLFHYSTTPKTSQTHSIQQPCIYIHRTHFTPLMLLGCNHFHSFRALLATLPPPYAPLLVQERESEVRIR